MGRRLKIAFVTAADPKDRRSWSGSTYYIGTALERHVGNVEFLGPMSIPGQQLKSRLADWALRFFNKRYYPTRTRQAAAFYANLIEAKLKKASYDLVVAPAASVEMALVETRLPIIYISDATFALLKDLYPIFSQLSAKSVANEAFFETSMVEKAALLVYASHWASDSAVRHYKADQKKIAVLPFGANIDNPPNSDSVLGKYINNPVNILFLAKEWQRKGGSIAFETLTALLDMNIDAKLTVCGVIPPPEYRHEKMEVIPYLNKNIPADSKRFQEILLNAHLFLLPSRAECYGVVFCEANAYGLPVFAPRVGGIPSIIKDGVNGYLLPLNADGREYAEMIVKSIKDAKLYASLNQGAVSMFNEKLNWDSWGKALRNTISNVVGL